MAYTALTLDVADRIATITANRPDKLNALNDVLITELGLAMDEITERDDVGGVIVTGAGRAFIAGADISEVGSASPYEAKRPRAQGTGELPQVRDVRKTHGRGGKRLRARRRVRAGDVLPHTHRERRRRGSGSPR